VLTPKQADVVASSLLVRAEPKQRLLLCPCCSAEVIPLAARKKLHPLLKIQCPACHAYLRLKWGRLLFLVYLAVVALLAFCEFSNVIPRFHNAPVGAAARCFL
jgi:hypothetical protein